MSKYLPKDYKYWEQLYIVDNYSCQRIAEITKVPKSTIQKHLKKQGLLKSNSESKKGRIPWNKDMKNVQTYLGYKF